MNGGILEDRLDLSSMTRLAAPVDNPLQVTFAFHPIISHLVTGSSIEAAKA